MFNVKWGLVSGGAAFALALITSLLLGGTSFAVALLRALGFAALFFGLGTGVWMLINTFLPELLRPSPQRSVTDNVFSAGSAGPQPAGSRINITLDDQAASGPAVAALPENGGDTPDTDKVGNFADLVSATASPVPGASPRKDIDQTSINSYTDDEQEELSPILDDTMDDKSEGFSLDFGAFVPDSEGLGESDSFMDSFSPFSADDDPGIPEEVVLPERKVARNKETKLEGDFNAKEIAAGLRTVLEKDKKK